MEASVSTVLSVIPVNLILLAVLTNLSGLILLILNNEMSAPLSIIKVTLPSDISVPTETKLEAFKFIERTVRSGLLSLLKNYVVRFRVCHRIHYCDCFEEENRSLVS